MRKGANDLMTVDDSMDAALSRNAKADDDVFATGHLLVEVFGEDGERKDFREVHNLILTVGKNMIADRLLASPTLGVPTHIGVGTSGTAAAAGDTTITGETRVALTSKTRSTNVVTFVGDWAAGSATGTLQETGLWDAVSAGNLVGRATYTSIAKGASDTLKITWTWTIA